MLVHYLLQQAGGVFAADPLVTVTARTVQPVSLAWLEPIIAVAVIVYVVAEIFDKPYVYRASETVPMFRPFDKSVGHCPSLGAGAEMLFA